MRTLTGIFNLFLIMFIMYACLIMYKDMAVSTKQLEEMKLNTVINYASNSAFNSVVTEGQLAVDKYEMDSITIDPTTVLDVYKTIVLKSYGIGVNKSSLDMMDNYISSAVIALDNGYYIATPKTKNDASLSWGLKKPYIARYDDNTYVSYNLLNERWTGFKELPLNKYILERGQTYEPKLGDKTKLKDYTGVVPERDTVLDIINDNITRDINYNLEERNKIYEETKDGEVEYYLGGQKEFISLQGLQTNTGVNAITRPMFFTTLTNVDFTASSVKLSAETVGGSDVTIRPKVLAFTENGKKYYCYDGQLPDHIKAEYVFPDTMSAANKGYYPNMKYLTKEMTPELKSK